MDVICNENKEVILLGDFNCDFLKVHQNTERM